VKKLLVVLVLGLVGVSWWWKDRAVAPQESEPAQSQVGGEVEVTVVPKQLTVGEEMIFEVTLNTHTVELDEDMTEIIKVSDSFGRDYRVVSWSGGKGGHHLSGELRVEELQKRAERIKLTIGGKIGVTKSIKA